MSSTDFIFGTKVQPNKAHSIIKVSMNLSEGQGDNLDPKSQVKVKISTKKGIKN